MNKLIYSRSCNPQREHRKLLSRSLELFGAAKEQKCKLKISNPDSLHLSRETEELRSISDVEGLLLSSQLIVFQFSDLQCEVNTGCLKKDGTLYFCDYFKTDREKKLRFAHK